jgi:serine/threonine protein kinase
MQLRALKRLPIPPYVPPSPVVPDPNAANIPPAQPISEDKKLASRYETEYSRSYDFYAAFREPMLLAAIRHPCVVKLYGIIREAEQYFEVLQFVDEDLQFALEDKPLSLQDTQRVMYHLLLAVDYLHRNDIVHRNLSTRSVMVTPSLANKNNQAAKKQKIGAGGRNQPPGPTIQLACFGNARSLQPPYPKHIMEDAIHAVRTAAPFLYFPF